jgi:membrane-bound serine protease (ClpP class)
MGFLFDPNVAFLLIVVSFVLTVLALFTPGTGLLEVGALFAIALSAYALYNLSINWWALIIIVVSIVPFFLSIRKSKRTYWLIPAVVLLGVGSVFLFKETATQQTINPFFAIFMSIVAVLLLWIIGRRTVDALKMKPAQDLKHLIGLIGEARTDVKVTGTIYVGGEEWSARSDEQIRSGAQVKVIDREGLVLVVEPVKESKQ